MTAPYIKESATSKAAAKSIEPHLTELQTKVKLWIKDCGKRGATCDELEHYSGIRHQTLSARVRELVLRGWIYPTQRTRKTRSGRQAVVYRTWRKRKPNAACVCDRPTCSRWPCKLLREYRSAWALITSIYLTKEFGIETIKDLLDHIESECEILVK
jgi:hypothetical protein